MSENTTETKGIDIPTMIECIDRGIARLQKPESMTSAEYQSTVLLRGSLRRLGAELATRMERVRADERAKCVQRLRDEAAALRDEADGYELTSGYGYTLRNRARRIDLCADLLEVPS